MFILQTSLSDIHSHHIVRSHHMLIFPSLFSSHDDVIFCYIYQAFNVLMRSTYIFILTNTVSPVFFGCLFIYICMQICRCTCMFGLVWFGSSVFLQFIRYMVHLNWVLLRFISMSYLINAFSMFTQTQTHTQCAPHK